MNRLFDKAPNDWQGDIVNKIKEYMKESDIFLNLHDGWGFHYPEHINWHKSPDRFGYSVIVDEEEFTCSNGTTLKLGEMAKKKQWKQQMQKSLMTTLKNITLTQKQTKAQAVFKI